MFSFNAMYFARELQAWASSLWKAWHKPSYETVEFVQEDGTELRSDSSRIIGIGRTGVVLKAGTRVFKIAKVQKLPRSCAQDFATIQEASNDRNCQDILTEKEVYRRLGNHGSIAQFFDSSSQLQLELEFIEGDILALFIRTRAEVSKAKKMEIILLLVDSLVHLHDCMIAHNDFTVNNVVVHASGIKVLDFGHSTLFPLTAVMQDEEEAQTDILCLGCMMYSIVSWTVYDPNDLENWTSDSFRHLRDTLQDLEQCLLGPIIENCLLGGYVNIRQVKDFIDKSMSQDGPAWS